MEIKEQFGQVKDRVCGVVKIVNVNVQKSVKKSSNVHMDEGLNFYSTNEELWMDVVPQIKTYQIDTTGNKFQQNSIALNTAPAVSIKADLELIQPTDLQVNLANNALVPIIFDTWASLAITSDKQNFLPNTFKKVTSLKLGEMAAGALIAGTGNVAWTFL